MRILLVHPDDAAILVYNRDGGFVLPKVRVSGRLCLDEPPAIIAAVRRQLGMEIIELFPLAEVVDEQAATVGAAVACEVRTGLVARAGATWIGADRIGVVAAPDRAPLSDAITRVSGEHRRRGRPPWFTRGWFADAQQWLCAAARDAGYEPVGPVEQFRIWGISSVLRVPTTGGMIYFKVSSDLPLFVNEALVTQCLGALFPGFVPVPLTIDAGRGWLALADFGEEVGWEAPADVKIEVFRRFAQLQIASAAHLDRLLEAGCVDRRLDWLADQQRAWFTGPQARQRLSIEEFSQLQACSAELPALCTELASCGVPDALLHGDIHPGNIARNERGYTFFDWTDAAIGQPFLDMIAIASENDAHTADAMRAAYLAEWATVTGPEPAERAWELAVVLMAANQAISYLSLASSIDPPNQEMAEAAGQWLRRLINSASELTHRRTQPANTDGRPSAGE